MTWKTSLKQIHAWVKKTFRDCHTHEALRVLSASSESMGLHRGCALSVCFHVSTLKLSQSNHSGPSEFMSRSRCSGFLFLRNVTQTKRMTVHFFTGGLWNTEYCVRIIRPGWSYNRGGIQSLDFQVQRVLFFFPSASPFLVCTASLTAVTPLVLLTDSTSSTPLPVIRSCHSYRGERMEKCTPVAGHRGSQVDALTKLEEDTEKREGENCQTKWAINTVCPATQVYIHRLIMYSEPQWWKVTNDYRLKPESAFALLKKTKMITCFASTALFQWEILSFSPHLFYLITLVYYLLLSKYKTCRPFQIRLIFKVTKF